MKKGTGFLLALIFVAGCIVGATSSQFVVPRARAEMKPQKWEYFCPDIDARDMQKKANEAGKQGWEMVMVFRYSDLRAQLTACFKRPLQ